LPLLGFYDNERLWLRDGAALPDIACDAGSVIFADADVRLDGAVVVSQHVVHHPGIPALRQPPRRVELINPNYLDVAHGRAYREKYPFSTAAWIWALAPEGLPEPRPSTPLLTGLLWAQDGGHRSVAEGRFRANCLEWAIDLVEAMPLAPAARALKGLAAEDAVGDLTPDAAIQQRARVAEGEIRRKMGRSIARGSWRNEQWCFSTRQQPPSSDPATPRGRVEAQRFLDAAATILSVTSAPCHLCGSQRGGHGTR
jgi:hypothetical protein